MSDEQIHKHYGRGGLLERILQALVAQGKNIENLSLEDLAGVDHFHSRGKRATDELYAASGFCAGMRVLDVGSGIGGPARYLADKGIEVVGIDVTPELCEIAADLTRRAGLESRASFFLGSVTHMEFPDASFDGAWMQHVGMNVRDKRRMFGELARVIRPGGRIALHEVLSGPEGSVYLPAPWASGPDSSFLPSQEEFRTCLEEAGFRVVHWQDDTEATTESLLAMLERDRASNLPPVSLKLLFGDDFEICFANYAKSLLERRCATVQAVVARQA